MQWAMPTMRACEPREGSFRYLKRKTGLIKLQIARPQWQPCRSIGGDQGTDTSGKQSGPQDIVRNVEQPSPDRASLATRAIATTAARGACHASVSNGIARTHDLMNLDSSDT
jgi:hypothetical protein